VIRDRLEIQVEWEIVAGREIRDRLATRASEVRPRHVLPGSIATPTPTLETWFA
jgi:hypothetical protein